MFDKREIKENMSVEEVEEILERLGAHFYRESDEKLVVETICHNPIGEGSHKLYYYDNTKLFNCYTACGAFDIFELIQKSNELNGKDISLDDAIRESVKHKGFMFFGSSENGSSSTILEEPKDYVKPTLKGYSREDIDRLTPAIVKDWFDEGIPPNIQQEYEVKYNPVDGAVVFPHYSQTGELIGIRQRNLADDMIYRFGKYRPAYIRGKLYTSPLSFYLFGAYRNRWPLQRTKRAILFEGEKSVMLYENFVGKYYNNSVASFGLNLSLHQFKVLEDLGVEEIVIAFDRQYRKASMEDEEYKQLVTKLTRLSDRFTSDTMTISFMMDNDDLLNYKDAPIDKGIEVFNTIYESRFTLEGQED